MKNYYITREELLNLHEMALEANKNKSYREGYLDSYNRFKSLLKELINKPVETTNEQPICKCGKHATLRTPQLANKIEKWRMAYFSCDDCFNRTWGGEN